MQKALFLLSCGKENQALTFHCKIQSGVVKLSSTISFKSNDTNVRFFIILNTIVPLVHIFYRFRGALYVQTTMPKVRFIGFLSIGNIKQILKNPGHQIFISTIHSHKKNILKTKVLNLDFIIGYWIICFNQKMNQEIFHLFLNMLALKTLSLTNSLKRRAVLIMLFIFLRWLVLLGSK